MILKRFVRLTVADSRLKRTPKETRAIRSMIDKISGAWPGCFQRYAQFSTCILFKIQFTNKSCRFSGDPSSIVKKSLIFQKKYIYILKGTNRIK